MSMGWLKEFPKFDPLQENLLGKSPKKSTEKHHKEEKKLELLEESFSTIVGLENLKQYFRVLVKGIVYKKIREGKSKAISLETLLFGTKATDLPPLLFVGNSGTGKSMAAKKIGTLLHNIGIIDSSNVVELNPGERYTNWTARGGVVLLNDLHRLIHHKEGTLAFELLSNIRFYNGCQCLIIYTIPNNLSGEEWNTVASFFREKMKIIRFDDYTDRDLAQIVHAKIREEKSSPYEGYKLNRECSVDAITTLLEKDTKAYQRRRLNGLLVDMILQNACFALEARLSLNACGEEIGSLKLEDLEYGLSSIEIYL